MTLWPFLYLPPEKQQEIGTARTKPFFLLPIDILSQQTPATQNSPGRNRGFVELPQQQPDTTGNKTTCTERRAALQHHPQSKCPRAPETSRTLLLLTRGWDHSAPTEVGYSFCKGPCERCETSSKSQISFGASSRSQGQKRQWLRCRQLAGLAGGTKQDGARGQGTSKTKITGNLSWIPLNDSASRANECPLPRHKVSITFSFFFSVTFREWSQGQKKTHPNPTHNLSRVTSCAGPVPTPASRLGDKRCWPPALREAAVLLPGQHLREVTPCSLASAQASGRREGTISV